MIGDQADISQRLKALLPAGWFPQGSAPVRDAILAGFASCFTFIFSQLAYLKLQTRIGTSTDGFLDLTAYDFFGNTVTRKAGQTDASFRRQIISSLFRQRNTVTAIKLVVFQLLGTIPVVREPQFASWTGGYGVIASCAYGAAGEWGSSLMNKQCFVDVLVPTALSLAPPFVGGYGSNVSAYSGGIYEYIGKPTLDPVLLADIYAAIASVLPVTGVAWVSIANGDSTSGLSVQITADSTIFDASSVFITTDGGSQ